MAYADVVVGLQYGDEGKARLVDMIAGEYDLVARFNGGANAGHTVQKGDVTLALNQVPSGVFYPEKLLYIGSGCALNFEKLAKEIAKIEQQGLNLAGRFVISPYVSVVQPHHLVLDGMDGGEIGTTKNGIGPMYADRATRIYKGNLANVRAIDFYDDFEGALAIVRKNLENFCEDHGLNVRDYEPLIAEMRVGAKATVGYITADPLWLAKEVEKGKNVLFEGAQSVMLDVSSGTVPYVTSSQTIAAAAFTGGDLSPKYLRKVYGVAKAVMSRVGYGTFVSEFGGARSEAYCMQANADGSPTYGADVEKKYDLEALLMAEDDLEMGKAMRVLSGEYGVVSKRPRRVGALDLVQLKYTIEMNGVDELVINKFDLLSVYARTRKEGVPVVTAYAQDGAELDYYPPSNKQQEKVAAVVKYLAHCSGDIFGIDRVEDLPEEVVEMVRFLEKYLGCRIYGIGTGPERNQFVKF